MKVAWLILVSAAGLATWQFVRSLDSPPSVPRTVPAGIAPSEIQTASSGQSTEELLSSETRARLEEILSADDAADRRTDSGTPTDARPPAAAEAGEPLPSDAAQMAAPPVTPSIVIRQQTALHPQMVTPGNFEYLGAIRPPLTDQNGNRFSYGGWSITFRPGAGPPRPGHLSGTLLFGGHRRDQLIAEITIPRPVMSIRRSLDDLPVADVVQPLSDITGGIRSRLSGHSSEPFEIGGLQVLENQIHWTIYKWYNVEGHDYLSHGISSTDLSRPRPQGLWHLGPVNSGDPRWHSYKHAGYVCEVPPQIARDYLGGMRLLSGLQICTGLQRSSQGPALFAWRTPASSLPHGASLQAAPLLWYSMARPVARHHYADRWTGAAWITLGDRQAVVVAGRKAHGPVHYGDPRPGDCYEDKGYHGSSYEAQMLFYAPGSLVSATRQPVADVAPWYRWDSNTPGGGIDRFFFQTCRRDVGGMTYDRRNNLLYLSEVDAGKLSDNEWETLPVIHVFRLVAEPTESDRTQ